MNAFPAYFPLAGRKVVIVGSGEHAEAKARLFVGSPAELVRIGDDEPGVYDPRTYAGAALAFISTASESGDIRAAAAARAAHVPVNVVDRPSLCDFFTPALVDRGEVVAAIGTGGNAPLLSAMLRKQIEAVVPEGAGRLAGLLGALRSEIREAFPGFEERRAFLRAVLEGPAAKAALGGEMDKAKTLMRAALAAARR